MAEIGQEVIREKQADETETRLKASGRRAEAEKPLCRLVDHSTCDSKVAW